MKEKKKTLKTFVRDKSLCERWKRGEIELWEGNRMNEVMQVVRFDKDHYRIRTAQGWSKKQSGNKRVIVVEREESESGTETDTGT